MRTYEKPPGSRGHGPNYAGAIAVTCLLLSLLAAWAVMRTNLVTASPTVTLAQSSKAQ